MSGKSVTGAGDEDCVDFGETGEGRAIRLEVFIGVVDIESHEGDWCVDCFGGMRGKPNKLPFVLGNGSISAERKDGSMGNRVFIVD